MDGSSSRFGWNDVEFLVAFVPSLGKNKLVA
jgi:hypothetical protein